MNHLACNDSSVCEVSCMARQFSTRATAHSAARVMECRPCGSASLRAGSAPRRRSTAELGGRAQRYAYRASNRCFIANAVTATLPARRIIVFIAAIGGGCGVRIPVKGAGRPY